MAFILYDVSTFRQLAIRLSFPATFLSDRDRSCVIFFLEMAGVVVAWMQNAEALTWVHECQIISHERNGLLVMSSSAGGHAQLILEQIHC